ncbi:hypothetical protein [Rhodococcus sp. USK13]|uniref:hypothetical protein n=1 Tax=Rhodococcus sp. USK13 TaxID=2806442 RepID=UPI001BCC36F3|nr:hypothetical protein [Rhodococcus sp. USK13]
MTNPPTVQRFGGAVVLTGTAVSTTLRAILVQIRARKRNGLPDSGELSRIVDALVSADGHADVRETPSVATSYEPSVPIEEAAKMLGLSTRQTRRLAPRLGGQQVAGRWLLDRQSILEHRNQEEG